MRKLIQVKKLGKAKRGYRILASSRRPREKSPGELFDTWIPGLAPSHTLRIRYHSGIFTWKEFAKKYSAQLRSHYSQNLIKPLALLSLRRTVVLLCHCTNRRHCAETILADAVIECRQKKNFALTP